MMKRVFLIGLVAASLAACDDDDDIDDNEFTIVNASSFVLTEVYIAEINDPNWGPNLLPDVLFPGDELEIEDIPCGTYDVLVVDENAVQCELSGGRLCFEEERTWVIDNAVLAVCAFGPPQRQGPAAPARVTEPVRAP